MNNITPRGFVPTLSSGRSAALLIDFDNVTMNVRSDLGKELNGLLNSDVFRGKIAVRRAYADWRRYPSSVVPMTEASIDLIFAPAYGTSKKNATDLRMAVDAIELAFMRPEIGTFILLTGDSDFSSCVMKLKEYGKYVIGVGMRESASDLLIQNCDEYYSYHNLSGLTRAVEDSGVREDPWELVSKAAQQMIRNRDVMRVDRLKQVMLDLDPGFNEKNIGYSKFSKFISEAQGRGLVRLRKDNQGQWEIVPGEPSPNDEVYTEEPRREREGGIRDRDRGRGRGRFRDRERPRGGDRERERPQPIAAEAPFDIENELAAERAAAERASAERPAAEEAMAAEFAPAESPRAEEPRSREPRAEAPRAEQAPSQPAAEAPRAEAAPAAEQADVDPLRNAYALLQHTVRAMVRGPGQSARDGDVKRRMMEQQPGFDEHTLGFSKFGRFLRQAHEAEVVDVRRQDDGGYEVLLPSSGKRLPAPVLTAGGSAQAPAMAADTSATPSADVPATEAAPSGRGRGGRGRGRRGGAPEGAPALLPGQVGATAEAVAPTPDPRVVEATAAPESDVVTPSEAIQEAEDGAIVTHREPAVATARIADPASVANRGSSASAGAVGIRARRGGRGRFSAEPSGPPPLLPGQGIPSTTARVEAPAAEPAREEAPAQPVRAEAPAPSEAPAQPVREEAPAARDEAPAAPPSVDIGSLGLPTDRDEVISRISSYNFVGRGTAETLVDSYGENVWRTLDENPDGVRELLGARKARPLLDQWAAERDALIAAAPAPAPEPEAAAPVEAAAETDAPADAGATAEAGDAPTLLGDLILGEEEPARTGRGRSRRGRGRGRGSNSAAQAEEVVGDTDPTLVGDAGTGAAPAGEDAPNAAAEADAVVGDTDPTLVGDAVTDAADEGGDAPRRSRSRRGGRGRGRGRAEGAADAGEAAAEAAAPEAAPVTEEAAPARASRGRGRAAAAPAEAPAAEAAPEAEAAPAARRGRVRGRGAAAPAVDAAPAAPVAEAADAGDGAGDDDGSGRPRPRRRGGRGRGRSRPGGEGE